MEPADHAAHSFFERHRSKIQFGGPSDCWLWTASKRHFGYGGVRIAGKTLGAHRAAYEAKNGAGSADGLVVRHKCDVPACVNPDHLELGTLADNNRDMVERGRHASGETHGAAKLTEADVREIRASYVRGSSEFGVCALGCRFGVAASVISGIVNRKLWTSVPTETAAKYAKLNDACTDYAMTHGDGFADRDWRGADDYCAEGYRLGEEAHDMPAEDRDDWIDAQAYAFPASAQYLVAVAADYRLAELVRAEAQAERVAA